MKTGVALFLCLLCVTALGIVNASHVSANDNSWTERASMPTSRAGLGVAAVNGRIYAIGGWNPCPINTTEEYNPSTDAWSPKSAMPTARMFFGTAVYQDRIYVMGGKVGQKATNVTEVYDPSTDKWTTKASMPIACYDLTANLVNGKIYLIGGIKPLNGSNIACINITQIYDPSTDKWTIGTPIPKPVYSYASAVVGSQIYVISGSTLSPNSSITSLNQVYDVDSAAWTLGAPVPTAVNAPAGISITDGSPKIFVIGGGGSEFHATYNLTQIYDVQSNSWIAGAPIPAYRFTLGAAFLDKTLYAIGGADNLAAKNEVYSINLGSSSPEFPLVALVVTCMLTVIVAVVVLLKVATAKSSE